MINFILVMMTNVGPFIAFQMMASLRADGIKEFKYWQMFLPLEVWEFLMVAALVVSMR